MDTIALWFSGISGFLVNAVLPATTIFVVGALLIRVVIGFGTKFLAKSKLEIPCIEEFISKMKKSWVIVPNGDGQISHT